MLSIELDSVTIDQPKPVTTAANSIHARPNPGVGHPSQGHGIDHTTGQDRSVEIRPNGHKAQIEARSISRFNPRAPASENPTRIEVLKSHESIVRVLD